MELGISGVRPIEQPLSKLKQLYGYLLLAEKLWHDPGQYSDSWNFEPPPHDCRPVRRIIEKLNELSDERGILSQISRSRTIDLG